MYHEKCISIEMINECSLVCSCPTDFKPTHHRNLGKRVSTEVVAHMYFMVIYPVTNR